MSWTGRHRLAPSGRMRQLQNERDLERLTIEEDAVLLLPVVVQTFSVIGHQQNEGAIVKVLLLQISQELAYDRVSMGDLAVIGERETSSQMRREGWMLLAVESKSDVVPCSCSRSPVRADRCEGRVSGQFE